MLHLSSHRRIDRYITSLASALTANVTREAKRGRCVKRPGNTDTAKQAHIASLETAVKAHIQSIVVAHVRVRVRRARAERVPHGTGIWSRAAHG